MKQWPKINSKVTFKGTHMFWFVNIVKDANELLEVGKEYTITKLELASSWCAVILEEFPDHKFSLSFFDYVEELTTEEQQSIEKYEYTSLKDIRDRVNLEACDKCSDLMKLYDTDISLILKAFDHKLKK